MRHAMKTLRLSKSTRVNSTHLSEPTFHTMRHRKVREVPILIGDLDETGNSNSSISHGRETRHDTLGPFWHEEKEKEEQTKKRGHENRRFCQKPCHRFRRERRNNRNKVPTFQYFPTCKYWSPFPLAIAGPASQWAGPMPWSPPRSYRPHDL